VFVTVLLLRTLRFNEIKTRETTDELGWVKIQLPLTFKRLKGD
jgi:hypothetical protein